MTDALKQSRDLVAAEALRVAAVIERDAADRDSEQRRQAAEIDFGEGRHASLDDTVIAPTPEWMAQAGMVVPYTPKLRDGTAKQVKTVRRYIIDQLDQLHRKGVLDDQQFRACRWYRDRREAAQMDPRSGVANYGETIRGDAVYGHLPSTEWAAEARADFRWASGFLRDPIKPAFQCVVIRNLSIKDTAQEIRRGQSWVRSALLTGADLLLDGIQFRLGWA